MIFEAQNSPNGVSIEGQTTSIKNITKQATTSEGVVIIDREKAVYLPNNVGDFKAIIDLLTDLLPKLTSVTSMPSPTWATDVVEYLTKLSQIKENLK